MQDHNEKRQMLWHMIHIRMPIVLTYTISQFSKHATLCGIIVAEAEANVEHDENMLISMEMGCVCTILQYHGLSKNYWSIIPTKTIVGG